MRQLTALLVLRSRLRPDVLVMVPSLKPSLPVEEVVGPLMLLLVEEVAVVQMHLQGA